MKSKLILMIVSLVVITSCTKERVLDLNKPEKVLKAYIEDRFNNMNSPSDKDKLVRYTTGKVRAFLEKMSDEDFKEKFLNSNLKLDKYRVITKKSTGDGKAQVTYEVALHTSAGATIDKVSNKKVAVFNQVSDEWLISEVKNLKTTIVLGEESIVLDPAVP